MSPPAARWHGFCGRMPTDALSRRSIPEGHRPPGSAVVGNAIGIRLAWSRLPNACGSGKKRSCLTLPVIQT